MIYQLSEKWDLELSPAIDDSEPRRGSAAWIEFPTTSAIARVPQCSDKIIKSLNNFHCVPIGGGNFPFVTEELANYLSIHTGNDFFYRKAEIHVGDLIFDNYHQIIIVPAVNFVEKENSCFDENGTPIYVKFSEANELDGHFVSRFPGLSIAWFAAQRFFDLLKNSKFSKNAFEFSVSGVIIPSHFLNYFDHVVCNKIAEILSDLDYHVQPVTLLRTKNPAVFKKRIEIRKSIILTYKKIANDNFSKDALLEHLVGHALLIARS